MSDPRFLALSLVLALALGACATRTPILTPEHLGDAATARVELSDTPFIAQQRYQCGPASLAMVLKASGVEAGAEELVPLVYIPKRKGSLQAEMVAAARRYRRIPYVIDATLGALAAELQAGRPVLVLQNLGFQSRPVWHYAVVIGYSMEEDRIILRSGTEERQLMPAWLFRKTWDRAGRWGLVALRPGELPARPQRTAYLGAVAAAEDQLGAGAALRAYQAALRHWPADPMAAFGRAGALHRLGRLEDAAHAYQALLATDPAHVAALNNLALVYSELGCRARALETIDQALAREGHDGALRAALADTRREIQERPAKAGCPPAREQQ